MPDGVWFIHTCMTEWAERLDRECTRFVSSEKPTHWDTRYSRIARAVAPYKFKILFAGFRFVVSTVRRRHDHKVESTSVLATFV